MKNRLNIENIVEDVPVSSSINTYKLSRVFTILQNKIVLFLAMVVSVLLIFVLQYRVIGSVVLLLSSFMAYREHTKNKRKSNAHKHTKRRSGQIYNKKQNDKHGKKNRKYKKKDNPNKRKDNEQES